MEAGQRFHPVQNSESTYRPLLIGTLAVMGLLQVASSVAILLHLTGYLQEVRSTWHGGLAVYFRIAITTINEAIHCRQYI